MRRLFATVGLLTLFAIPLFGSTVALAAFDPFGPECVKVGETTETCEVCSGKGATSEVCQTAKNKENPVAGQNGVLVTILNILSFIVGVASVLMVIYGGLKYVLSSGNSDALNSAKNTVLYALVGLVVFLFSQVIIRFVISKL